MIRQQHKRRNSIYIYIYSITAIKISKADTTSRAQPAGIQHSDVKIKSARGDHTILRVSARVQ